MMNTSCMEAEREKKNNRIFQAKGIYISIFRGRDNY